MFFAGTLRGFWCLMALCVLSTHGKTVTYYRRYISKIPINIPPDTTQLIFTYEPYLTRLPANVFQSLNVLTYLEVSHSEVINVDDGAFSGLDVLTNLQLVQNEINNLPDLSGIADTLIILNLERNLIVFENIRMRLIPMVALEELTLNSCGISGMLTLPVLSTLKRLYANTNSITHLDPILFTSLTHLQVFELNANSITHLDQAFFTSFANLKVFELANNQLQHMDLAFPVSLNQLNYYDNKIPSITRTNVSTLIGVRVLNLGKNDFSSLEDHMFADLAFLTSLSLQYLGLVLVPELSDVTDTLTSLYLDNNPIPLENTANLYGLDKLQRLHLHHCQLSGTLTLPIFPDMIELQLNDNLLTRLSPGIFQGYNNLSSLSLQNNQINILGMPTDFPITLTHLDLSTNPITVLPSEAFAVGGNTSNLRAVILFGCDILTVELGAFNGLDHVAQVRMYDNAVTVLTSGFFFGLSGATRIELQESSLTAIEVGTFNGQKSLAILDLGGNALTTLPVGTFQGLVSLMELRLDNNDLSPLQRGTFQELASLVRLYLNGNMLTTLVHETFIGLDRLLYLYLNTNTMQVIEDGAFDGLFKLRELYLHDNSLLTFPKMTEIAGSLVILHVHNNPTMTSINTSYLINFNLLMYFYVHSCSLSGNLDLPVLPFLQNLLVHRNRLSGINPKLFRGFNNLYKVDLSSNQFGQLPLFKDSSGIIDPSSNGKYLTHVGFDKTFHLYLRYNHISAVPQASISTLTRGWIYLENNPIDCVSMCWMFDCRTRKFATNNVKFPKCLGCPWNGRDWGSGDDAYLCPRKLGI